MSHIRGRTALQMEAEQSHMTEMIYDLALEIIYLLTGEKHAAVKMAAIEGLLRGVYPPLSVGGSLSQTPITKPPSHSWIPESNNQKILDVTRKIMELLAGEVSGAKKSNTVEEDLFLDRIMENRPPITPLDRTRMRNPPERCPRLLYPPQEDQEIPHHFQVYDEMTKSKIKEEAEVLYVRDDDWSIEEEASPELLTGSTQKGCNTSHQYQDENVVIVKHEEEADVMHGEQCKEGEISPHISADWGHAWDTQQQSSKIDSNGGTQSEDDITTDFPDFATSHFQPLHILKTFPCTECGRCFSEKLSLIRHERVHIEKPYSCSVCGRRFSEKANLIRHGEVHIVEKPYSCPECGKCFSKKFNFISHKRVHVGEKPYSCSVCGRSFSQKAHLIRHERVHTGEKPYACPECGKCFSRKFNFMVHRRLHTGEKPYSCSVCGKAFTHKSNLIKHEQAHIGKNLL